MQPMSQQIKSPPPPPPPPPDDAYDAGGYGQFSKDVMCRMAKEKWPRKNGLGKMAEEKWPKQSEII